MNKSILIILLFLVLILISCSEEIGTFAFKRYNDERFLIVDNLCEFKQDEEVVWTFCYKKVPKQKKLGVVILKKEHVWVDIYSFYDYVHKTKPCIFGTIKNYETGKYKILIVDEGKTIAEKEFYIYNDTSE